MSSSDLVPRRTAELTPLSEPDQHALMAQLAAGLLASGQQSTMVVLASTAARAYVYAGEWVADCPAGCNNTQFVTDKPPSLRGVAGTSGPRRRIWHCTYCGHLAELIDWPDEADDVMRLLDRRPIPHTRNWYPAGHLTAVQFGIPHGQTIVDLLAENDAHGVA